MLVLLSDSEYGAAAARVYEVLVAVEGPVYEGLAEPPDGGDDGDVEEAAHGVGAEGHAAGRRVGHDLHHDVHAERLGGEAVSGEVGDDAFGFGGSRYLRHGGGEVGAAHVQQRLEEAREGVLRAVF